MLLSILVHSLVKKCSHSGFGYNIHDPQTIKAAPGQPPINQARVYKSALLFPLLCAECGSPFRSAKALLVGELLCTLGFFCACLAAESFGRVAAGSAAPQRAAARSSRGRSP